MQISSVRSCGVPGAACFSNANAAIAPIKKVFDERGIAENDLPPVNPKLLPLDEVAERRRAEAVAKNSGAISPAW